MEIYTLLWTTVKQVFNRVNSVHNSRFLRVVKLEFGSFGFLWGEGNWRTYRNTYHQKMRNSGKLNPSDAISESGTQATAVEKRALISEPSLCTLMQFNDKLIHFWKYI